MSPEDNTNEQATNETNTVTNVPETAEEKVRKAVNLADSLSAIFRDKRSASRALISASPETISTLQNFADTVTVQAASEKLIYSMSVEAARARNAASGKTTKPRGKKKAA
jgi:hypothetical protein